MKIYTKTGDNGKTSLIGGKRVSKNDLRIEAYGTVDELNSIVGMIMNFDIDEYDKNIFSIIQNKLFDIGSCLAVDSDYTQKEIKSISESDISFLEAQIDNFSIDLTTPKAFIIPAGSFLISWCNIARTICRRTERRMVAIKGFCEKYNNCLIFVNRLSDFLFIMGRKYAKENDIDEIYWNNSL